MSLLEGDGAMSRAATVLWTFPLFAIVVVPMAPAQDPLHHLWVEDDIGYLFPVSVFNRYTHPDSDIAGWTWGNCIENPTVIDIVSVQPGPHLSHIQGGDPPDVNIVVLYPGEGWTVAVIIDLQGQHFLQPGNGQSLHKATYQILSTGSSQVCYCDSLGDPPVVTEVTDTDGNPFVPSTECGTLVVMADGPHYRYYGPDASLVYDPSDGTGEVTVTVAISELDPYMALLTEGFSMGLSHDPELLSVVPGSVVPAAEYLEELGMSPAFFGPAVLANGWTVGVLHDFFCGQCVVFPQDPLSLPSVQVTYETVPETLAGNLVGEIVPLIWADDLGSPPVPNTVVVWAEALEVDLSDGTIELVPLLEYVRADCNDDGAVNIADAIFILNTQFQGGPAETCTEACDANADGGLNVADSIFILSYRLLDGPPPPPPFPECGGDPTVDPLGCLAYLSCF